MAREPRDIGEVVYPEETVDDPIVGVETTLTGVITPEVPARIEGGPGLRVYSENLGWRIVLSYGDLPVYPDPEEPLFTHVWRETDGAYFRVDFTEILTRVSTTEENFQATVDEVVAQADAQIGTLFAAWQTAYEVTIDARLDAQEALLNSSFTS